MMKMIIVRQYSFSFLFFYNLELIRTLFSIDQAYCICLVICLHDILSRLDSSRCIVDSLSVRTRVSVWFCSLTMRRWSKWLPDLFLNERNEWRWSSTNISQRIRGLTDRLVWWFVLVDRLRISERDITSIEGELNIVSRMINENRRENNDEPLLSQLVDQKRKKLRHDKSFRHSSIWQTSIVKWDVHSSLSDDCRRMFSHSYWSQNNENDDDDDTQQ